MAVSDIVSLMNAGVLVQTGAPTDLYFRPRTRFVAEFVGVANLVPGTLRELGADGFRVETAHGPCLAEKGSDALQAGQACLVMIRPQDLVFAEPGTGVNMLAAEIVGHAFLGATVRYTLKTRDLDLRLDAPAAPEGPRQSGGVALRFAASRAFVVPAS
jgi:ABC-type Fe3+/spermidine/putrescine transport system ATPase subunit